MDGGLAALGLVVSLALVVIRTGEPVSAFGGMVIVDDLPTF